MASRMEMKPLAEGGAFLRTCLHVLPDLSALLYQDATCSSLFLLELHPSILDEKRVQKLSLWEVRQTSYSCQGARLAEYPLKQVKA